MAWTKATYLSNTRIWMDAVASTRWSDTFLYSLLGLKFREEWTGILDACPTYRFAQRSVTTAADGTFALSSLNSGSGDSLQTLNKILTITDGNSIVYQETNFSAVPLGTVGANASLQFDRLYYLAGTNAQILPATSTALTITVNHTPTVIDSLSGDSVEADFPTGYEHLVALSAAADALATGGTETSAAGDLRALAQTYRQALYGEMQRRTTNPLVMGFTDRAAVWGA